jgi:hypothetical protein
MDGVGQLRDGPCRLSSVAKATSDRGQTVHRSCMAASSPDGGIDAMSSSWSWPPDPGRLVYRVKVTQQDPSALDRQCFSALSRWPTDAEALRIFQSGFVLVGPGKPAG